MLSDITDVEPVLISVDNQTIEISASFDLDSTLTFSPTFIPELAGTYSCERDFDVLLTTGEGYDAV